MKNEQEKIKLPKAVNDLFMDSQNIESLPCITTTLSNEAYDSYIKKSWKELCQKEKKKK